MPVRVEIRQGEDLFLALRRLAEAVDRCYGRPWTKRRFGYYEKPSILRRKKARMRRRQLQAGGGLKLHIRMEAQFNRTGPDNALGR